MKVIAIFAIYFIFFSLVNYLFIKKEKSKNIVLLLFMFTFSFYLSLGKQFVLGESSNILVHSVAIATICCLLMVINKSTIRIGKEIFFFLPLFIYFGFDFFLRVVDYPKYSNILFTYLTIFLIFLIFRSVTNINFDKIIYSINFLAIFNGILSIAQYISGKKLLIGGFTDSVLYTEGAVDTIRAIGLAGTNNSAGNFAALLFPIVLYNCLKQKQLVCYLALLLTLSAAALSLTRIGYVAIIAVSVMFLILYRPKSKKGLFREIIWLNFSIPLITLALYIASSALIQKLFTERGDTQSSRFDQFERVKDYVLSDHWLFGIGTGQYRIWLYNNYGLLDIDIHSQYLDVLAENGIFIFLLFFWFNFWILIKILKSNTDRLTKLMGLSIFTANIICANFNPNQQYYLGNVFYFFIMFTLLFKVRKVQ